MAAGTVSIRLAQLRRVAMTDREALRVTGRCLMGEVADQVACRGCCKLPPSLFRELADKVVQSAGRQLRVFAVALLTASEGGFNVRDQSVLERILSDHVRSAKVRFPFLE